MGDGEVGPCSKMMFAVCSGFSPALDLKITSPSALGAAAAGHQQFPAVSGKSLPRKGSLCPLERINLLFSAPAGTRRSSSLKHNVPPQSFRNELFPRNPRTPTNFPEIPLPTAGSPAGKAEYPYFFFPLSAGSAVRDSPGGFPFFSFPSLPFIFNSQSPGRASRARGRGGGTLDDIRCQR